MTSWALSADLRSPQAIASAELKQLTLLGKPLAQSIFRSSFSSARQHALGGGKEARQLDRSRRAAYELALEQARKLDTAFQVDMSDGWLDQA